jgi:cytochrome P450
MTQPVTRFVEIDFASATFKGNPYPAFAHLRMYDPVHLLSSSNGQNSWLITRYEDAMAALRDERFVKNRRSVITPQEHAQTEASVADLLSMGMVDFDPPDHTRLRALVNPFFTPRAIDLLHERVQAITDELIDAVEGKGSMDLIADFAFSLPLRVISELLGIPATDVPQLHLWTKHIADALDDPVASYQAEEYLQVFYAYLLELIERKCQAPANDLISKLVQAETNDHLLSRRELVSMIFLLITAGHDTTDNLIGNGMLALLTHPEQMALLRQDPTLIKTAVEEFLRFYSPFMFATRRWAREDVEFGDKQIRRGDMVGVLLASVNRDETAFTKADELDITRQENRHLAFGKGIHYCIGAPLARLEGQIAINTLLRRLPHLGLQGDPSALVWRTGWLVTWLNRLPVVF